jgi:orotate phosphoribosyltransferase
LIYTSDELIKLVHDTKALSIWDRKKGPVFWYIANVPGPFYLNTELMLGHDLSVKLLNGIDAILAGTTADNAASRAAQLNTLIMSAYEKDETFQRIVATMAIRAQEKLPADYSFVSGGERRDWLFSIPFARQCGKKHVFLFKNKDAYCEQGLQPNEAGIHISDLINNAASYFDAWFPALDKNRLRCLGTVSVNSRGDVGVKRLESYGQKVITLTHIDLAFFEQSVAGGLIEGATRDELACYFTSEKEWATLYLMDRAELFDVANIDKKSFGRLQSFFASDPWHLRDKHAGFFADMQARIAERLKDQAA